MEVVGLVAVVPDLDEIVVDAVRAVRAGGLTDQNPGVRQGEIRGVTGSLYAGPTMAVKPTDHDDRWADQSARSCPTSHSAPSTREHKSVLSNNDDFSRGRMPAISLSCYQLDLFRIWSVKDSHLFGDVTSPPTASYLR